MPVTFNGCRQAVFLVDATIALIVGIVVFSCLAAVVSVGLARQGARKRRAAGLLALPTKEELEGLGGWGAPPGF